MDASRTIVRGPGQRASAGETIEIVGKIARENVCVVDGIDEKRKGFGFGATLDAKDFVDGGEIDGIGGEGHRACQWESRPQNRD